MKRLIALMLALHLLGQWSLYRVGVTGKAKTDAHALYCFCQNCPGEPYCCCGKAQTPQEGLRLSALCDQPMMMLLTAQHERTMLTASFAIFPLPLPFAFPLLTPQNALPSACPSPLEKPPRLL
jgi:hypothetical protein